MLRVSGVLLHHTFETLLMPHACDNFRHASLQNRDVRTFERQTIWATDVSATRVFARQALGVWARHTFWGHEDWCPWRHCTTCSRLARLYKPTANAVGYGEFRPPHLGNRRWNSNLRTVPRRRPTIQNFISIRRREWSRQILSLPL